MTTDHVEIVAPCPNCSRDATWIGKVRATGAGTEYREIRCVCVQPQPDDSNETRSAA